MSVVAVRGAPGFAGVRLIAKNGDHPLLPSLLQVVFADANAQGVEFPLKPLTDCPRPYKARPTSAPAKAAARPTATLPTTFRAARPNSPDSADWTPATISVENVV